MTTTGNYCLSIVNNCFTCRIWNGCNMTTKTKDMIYMLFFYVIFVNLRKKKCYYFVNNTKNQSSAWLEII